MTVTEREPPSAPSPPLLIDERGLEQLSMRKLGAELGVEAMSLYSHVDGKDDLLGAVAVCSTNASSTTHARPATA